MKITVDVRGIDAVKKAMARNIGQARYAASRALNTTAFAINAELKREMDATFKGGATAYTKRAFKVSKASKHALEASITLRDDAPEGGMAYSKALQHLFTGGTRDWKKLEGFLRGLGLVPDGYMAVPGFGAPLDARGNMRKAALNEMLGVIRSSIRNLRVVRRTGGGGKAQKEQKGIGYFVVLPGAKTKLHPGIWKRIESGSSSSVAAMIMYVRPGTWRRFIDLESIGKRVVNQVFEPEFKKEFAAALSSAR